VKTCPVQNVRNFVLAGHAAAGKTTLADLVLFKAGAVSRLGSVDQKTSVSDFRAEEQERRGSLYAAALNCQWKEHQFHFLDTPGGLDFCGEAIAAQAVADAAVIVVDAVGGVGPGTLRALKESKALNQPRAIFINGLDKDQADFHQALAQVQEAFGGPHVCVPFVLPIGANAGLKGVAPVLKKDVQLPGELATEAARDRQEILDDVAEEDETLMEHYLTDGDLSPAELERGLHLAVLHNHIVPVFCGSAAKDIGVNELLDGIIALFPDPTMEEPVRLVDGVCSRRAEADHGMAQVFKTVSDPFIGQLSLFRVYSGVFKADQELFNVSTGAKERPAGFLLLNGKESVAATEAGPGAIMAVAKLKSTHLNNTLSTKPTAEQFAPIAFPQPTLSLAVHAANRGEEEKIGAAIHRIMEEDPTIRLERNDETHETVIHGMGDQHLQGVLQRLRNSYKLDARFETPKVPYRETVLGSGSFAYRHKKQSGGHGQFAEVHLRLEANPVGGFEFASEVVGGSIPRNYIPAVEKGVVEAMERGPLAGCRVINLKAVVYDGKHHDVDSSEMAFKIAARGAFRGAMAAARPMLLEPVMKLKVIVPEEYMGDVTGDINSRRGHILGMDSEEGFQVLTAEMPLVETFTYGSSLRSLTHGKGSFELAFDRYEPVPGNLSKQIQEAAAKNRIDEVE